MSDLIDWFGNPIEVKTKVEQSAGTNPNPCVNVYGPGPEEKHCKDCLHLVGLCMAKTYYKCDLRRNTHGRSTDHKVRWETCAKFEQREGSMRLVDGRS